MSSSESTSEQLLHIGSDWVASSRLALVLAPSYLRLLICVRADQRLEACETAVRNVEGGTSEVKGTVKWFNNAKGYGFLTAEGKNDDIFVHHTSIQSKGFRTLAQGEPVEFELIEGDKGLKADNVVRLQA